MLKILANDGMDKDAVKELIDAGHKVDTEHYEGEELIQVLNEADVVVIRSKTKIRADLIDKVKGGSLKLIIRAGVGIDNIDHIYARENGIEVRNTPNSSSDSVAELTLAHMFTLARHLQKANVTMREGKWNKKDYSGTEIASKTLGLIGFGRISKSLARKAKALGMSVNYYDIVGENKNETDFTYMSFEDILRTSDYISLHVPFIKEKGAVISEKEFDMMKEGAYLINCARGGVVDEEALLRALDEGKIAGAALDVFEEEPLTNESIYTHEKISLTPHIGAATAEAQKRIGNETIEVIKDFFNN